MSDAYKMEGRDVARIHFPKPTDAVIDSAARSAFKVQQEFVKQPVEWPNADEDVQHEWRAIVMAVYMSLAMAAGAVPAKLDDGD